MHVALGSSHLAGVGSRARVVPHLSHVAKLEPRARGRAARQAHNERLHRITHCLRVGKLTQILAMPGAHSARETAALMLAWVRDRSSRAPARHVPVGLTERELSLYPSSHCGVGRKGSSSLRDGDSASMASGFYPAPMPGRAVTPAEQVMRGRAVLLSTLTRRDSLV